MNDLLDFLLEYQDEYCTGEPSTFQSDNTNTFIYSTKRGKEMYVKILNSVALLKRIHAINIELTDLVFTESCLVIEFTQKS